MTQQLERAGLVDNPPCNKLPADDLVEFGPKNVIPMPHSLINELPEQVRKTYEPSQINDLAAAMELMQLEDETHPQFDMYNPLLCAYLTSAEATQYLDKYSVFHNIRPVDISTLRADPQGNYCLLISGHRRKRAIEQLTQKHELDTAHIQIQINLRPHINFEEALIAQVRENTYEKVPPEETAKYVEQFYAYLLSEQTKKPTHIDVARKLGLSESVVATALRFCSLPEEIQVLAQSKTLPYSTVAKLEVILRKRTYYYEHLSSMGQKPYEPVEEYCLEHLRIITNKIMRLRLDRSEKVDKLLQREVATLDQLTLSYQDELVLLSPEMNSAGRQRKRSATLLAETALTSLLYAVGQNPAAIKPADLNRLEELVQEAKNYAKHTEPQEDLLF